MRRKKSSHDRMIEIKTIAKETLIYDFDRFAFQ